MAYSNVTPPPLPEYDTETYGFYVLVFNYGLGDENWYSIDLLYSAWRFQYDEGVGVTNTGNVVCMTYDGDKWVENPFTPEQGELALNPGINGSVYQRIYTNENIFNGDELWLAADSVTPVDDGKFPIKDFINGMIIALCTRPKSGPSTTGLKKGLLNCRPVPHLVPYQHTDTWVPVTISNTPSNFSGDNVWTDGVNVYYSNHYNKDANTPSTYVLRGNTWEPKTWDFDPFVAANGSGWHIWTDGTEIYFSKGEHQYVLRGNTWESKEWKGRASFGAFMIWTDGTEVYSSSYDKQYILKGDTWEQKEWKGFNRPEGDQIWSNGNEVYYSLNGEHYVLRGDTWEARKLNGISVLTASSAIWSDGNEVYYSPGASDQRVLRGDAWEAKTWEGAIYFFGSEIWTDGNTIYCTTSGDTFALV